MEGNQVFFDNISNKSQSSISTWLSDIKLKGRWWRPSWTDNLKVYMKQCTIGSHKWVFSSRSWSWINVGPVWPVVVALTTTSGWTSFNNIHGKKIEGQFPLPSSTICQRKKLSLQFSNLIWLCLLISKPRCLLSLTPPFLKRKPSNLLWSKNHDTCSA